MPTILSLRDSVFDPVLASFADDRLPYADDESVLPRQQIEQDLDGVENQFAQSMSDLMRVQVGHFVDSLQPAIAAGDLKAINNADWQVQPPLQQLLWGLWSDGWETGQQHAGEEIQIKSGGNFTLRNTWAAFAGRARRKKEKAKTRQDGFPRGVGRLQVDERSVPDRQRQKVKKQLLRQQPKVDLRQVPLKGSYLEQAVNERLLLLSDQVSEDVKEQIRGVIRDRVIDNGSGKLSAAAMNDRIQQILEGNPDDVQGGIYGRAKTIGKTETTAVYSLGRLHTYKDSGRVQKVRYQTFEYARPQPGQRPCLKCVPKNGHILDLDRDWQLITTTYLIPAHGNCFPAGTKISMADGSRKNIENIEVDDRVLTATAEGVQRVYNTMRKELSEDFLTQLTLEDGTILEATANHPIWNGTKFVPAATYRAGEYVFRLEGMGTKVSASAPSFARRDEFGSDGNCSSHWHSLNRFTESAATPEDLSKDKMAYGLGLDGSSCNCATTSERNKKLRIPEALERCESRFTPAANRGSRSSSRGFSRVTRVVNQPDFPHLSTFGNLSKPERIYSFFGHGQAFSEVWTTSDCYVSRREDGHGSDCSKIGPNKRPGSEAFTVWEYSFEREQGSDRVSMASCGTSPSITGSQNHEGISTSSQRSGLHGQAFPDLLCQNEAQKPYEQPCHCQENANQPVKASPGNWVNRGREEVLQMWGTGRHRTNTFPLLLGSQFCQDSQSSRTSLGIREAVFLPFQREILHTGLLFAETESVYRNKGLLGTGFKGENSSFSVGAPGLETGDYRREEIQNSEKVFQGLTPLRVVAIEKIPFSGTVYNFSVETDEVYIANGILVHNCRCAWMPIIEADPKDQAAIADPGRAPQQTVGAGLGAAWMGFAINRAGQLVVSEAMKQAIAAQQAERARRKKRQQMFAGLGLGALSLSFAGMFYLFFKHWQQERQTTAGGNVVTPTGPDLGEVAVQLGEQLKAEATRTVGDVQKMLTPDLLNQLASGVVDLNNPSISSLKGLGLSQAEATRMNSFLQAYAKWLQARPSVRVGNIDINTATAAQLVATGMFSPKQAAAIVAYTQKTPISKMADLGKIRYQGRLRQGQPIFRAGELDGVVGRLQTYWLQPNLNARSLTAADLVKRFGVRPATAEKIMQERDRGFFSSYDDLKKRLKGQVSDASLKLLQKRGMRVDFDDPLPSLDVIEQKDVPLLMPAAGTQPVPLRRMVQPLQPAGQPPIPVDLTAQQQAVRDYLVNTPRRLAGEASGFLGQLTQAIPPDLLAAAEAYQKKTAAERQMQQAYQRYVANAAALGDQVSALEEEFDTLPNRIPGTLAIDYETRLNQLLQGLEQGQAVVGGEAKITAAQAALNEIMSQGRTIQGRMMTAMQSRVLLDDTLTQQRNAILGEMGRYLQELNDPQVYQLAGDDFMGDIQQLRAVWGGITSWLNEDRNALVKTVQDRINNLSKMANSLIRDPAGARADISDAVLRLRALQKELQGKDVLYHTPVKWARFNRPTVLRLRQNA